MAGLGDGGGGESGLFGTDTIPVGLGVVGTFDNSKIKDQRSKINSKFKNLIRKQKIVGDGRVCGDKYLGGGEAGSGDL